MIGVSWSPKQHFYSLSSFCDLAILEFKNVTNNDDEVDFGGFPQVQMDGGVALLPNKEIPFRK